MSLIDVGDVQPWLEETKLSLDSDDTLIEEPFQSEFVRSRLSSCGLDVSTWVDENSTPVLIRQIIGMLVAGQRYNRFYSETDEDAGNPYANKLEERAHLLLDGICMGSITLIGVPDEVTANLGTVSFYPDDSVGVLDPEEAVRFTMGRVF